ncbi:hypothetical protein [Thalassobaculum sp.]|uniref:hypothetical protein n=1 Tax=Thalassobaculum sp. TaxID=2022740 RepID=UPI0032EC23E8
MNSFRQLALIAGLPIAAGLALSLVVAPARWLAFTGQVTVTVGTIATLVPAAVIGLRMLRAIPASGQARIQPLDDFLQSVAQEPRRWHYWMLISGLALVLIGSVMSSVAAWPP